MPPQGHISTRNLDACLKNLVTSSFAQTWPWCYSYLGALRALKVTNDQDVDILKSFTQWC